MRVLELLDRSPGGRLELDNGMPIIVRFGIDNDLKLQAFGIHDSLEGFEVDPEVVGVEDLEFANLRGRTEFRIRGEPRR